MTTINSEEPTAVSLGKALQNARLSASLTVEEVAEKLNLSVSTVRGIEDELDMAIETNKYPSIYLRGYIANYAKLVSLDKYNQFPEYRQLLARQEEPRKPHPSVQASVARKKVKQQWLVLALMVIIGLAVTVQQLFFSGNQTSPVDKEALQTDNISASSKLDVIEKNESVDSSLTAEKPTEAAPLPQSESDQDSIDNEPLSVEKKAEIDVATQPVLDANPVANVEQVVENVEQTVADAVTLAPLQLRFSADCWTEIFDARGKRLAFDLYSKGDVLNVEGVTPFQLKLGEPTAVVIEYQDKIFKHDSVAGRTLRFTIPQ